MIQLISIVNANISMPPLENCIIKNILNNNRINNSHKDFSLDFILNILKKDYLNKIFVENKLSQEEQYIINNIENVKNLKENTLLYNYYISRVLKLFYEKYGMKWEYRDIKIMSPISTIDDLIKYSFSTESGAFDILFNDFLNNTNDNTTHYYINIEYAYHLPFALRLSKLLKTIFNKCKILFGGKYITQIMCNCKELMNKVNYIDAIFFYGNYLNIINYIKNKDLFDCFIRKDNQIVEYPSINTPWDCNLYIPDFDDLDLNLYLSPKVVVPFLLNFGCYHSKCIFCNRYLYYKGHHIINLTHLIKSLKLLNKHNIEYVCFMDECVTPQILEQFARQLIDHKLNINWLVETRFHKKFLDKDFIKLLQQSNLKIISFGYETTSQRLLNLIQKDINTHWAKKILKYTYRAGIMTNATFMWNLPTETKKELKKLLNFIKKFKYIDGFGLAQFKLLRNSKIANQININYEDDILYMYNYINKNNFNSLIDKFYTNNKISSYLNKRKKILNRTQYFFIKKQEISLNYKG